jgi:phenylacetic acid degradation operon negative regulatory protein
MMVAQRRGAKALLLTILGEFVLPSGGSAWTASLVGAAATMHVGEKNARQAIARIGDQGLIESERHGRTARWSLTDPGRELLESGADRIYELGTKLVEWQGEWLVAHCPVGEEQRALRHQLRTKLRFLGFGELSANLLISPHIEREPALRSVLDDLGLQCESTVLRSTTSSSEENAALVARAWNLDALAESYRAFWLFQSRQEPRTPDETFASLAALVHEWRRFPFSDPELPTQLLPQPWQGTAAAQVFQQNHDRWSSVAQHWFADLEAQHSVRVNVGK